MQRLPGAAVCAAEDTPAGAENFFVSLFAAGGLTLSQVANVMGLESYIIQNWVARGFLTPPVKKRYSRDQLSRLLLINTLRAVLPLDDICRLIGYVNGRLDDSDDDTVADSQLYMYLLRAMHGEELSSVSADYEEPFPGAGERLERVLEIMLTAARAGQLRSRAEDMISALPETI